MDAQKFNRLLKKIKNDKNAATVIYDEYYDRVKGHIQWHFGKSVDPLEMVQEVFLKLLETEPSGYVRYPTAWMYRFADNCVTDILRRRHTDAQLIEGIVGEFDLEQAIASDDLKTAMSHLDELSQRILHMRFWEKYTPGEIAVELNMTSGNVRKKISRAYKKLKNYL